MMLVILGLVVFGLLLYGSRNESRELTLYQLDKQIMDPPTATGETPPATGETAKSGQIVDKLVCGDGMPTNCCFGGTDLYVTESRRGTIRRFPLGVTGLPLPHG